MNKNQSKEARQQYLRHLEEDGRAPAVTAAAAAAEPPSPPIDILGGASIL